MPLAEDITDKLQPTFDYSGHTNGTSQDDSATKDPLQPANPDNVVIVPVNPTEEKPLVPAPAADAVDIIDTGAEAPEAWIVHNKDDDSANILVDLANEGSDAPIVITEVPGANPTVKVGDHEATVVDIGSVENHPEVIHVEDSETGENTTKVIDNLNPKIPVVYDVDTYPKVPSVEAIVIHTHKPIPIDAKIKKSW